MYSYTLLIILSEYEIMYIYQILHGTLHTKKYSLMLVYLIAWKKKYTFWSWKETKINKILPLIGCILYKVFKNQMSV